MLKQLDIADSVRRQLSPETTPEYKADLGQFLTPATVARFMASMFPPSNKQTCRLLDAGAGVGSLSCAFSQSRLQPTSLMTSSVSICSVT